MEFTHIANPVRIAAQLIIGLDPETKCGGYLAELSDGSTLHVDAAMCARHTPVVGDYVVTQEDGYRYINPQAVFERKYRLIEPNEEFDTLALSLELSGHSTEIRTRDDRIAELEAQLAALVAEKKAASDSTALQVRAQITSQMLSQGGVQPLKRADDAVQYILSGTLPAVAK